MQEPRDLKIACHAFVSFFLSLLLFAFLLDNIQTFRYLKSTEFQKCVFFVDTDTGLYTCDLFTVTNSTFNQSTTTMAPITTTTTTTDNTSTTTFAPTFAPTFVGNNNNQTNAQVNFQLHTHAIARGAEFIYVACVVMILPMLFVQFVSCCNRTSRQCFYKCTYFKCPAAYRHCFRWFYCNPYTLFVEQMSENPQNFRLYKFMRSAVANWFVYTITCVLLCMCIGATLIASSSALYELSLCCGVDKQKDSMVQKWHSVLKNTVAILTVFIVFSVQHVTFQVFTGFRVFKHVATTQQDSVRLVKVTNLSDESQSDLDLDEDENKNGTTAAVV